MSKKKEMVRLAIFGKHVIIDDGKGKYEGPFLVFRDAKTAVKHILNNYE